MLRHNGFVHYSVIKRWIILLITAKVTDLVGIEPTTSSCFTCDRSTDPITQVHSRRKGAILDILPTEPLFLNFCFISMFSFKMNFLETTEPSKGSCERVSYPSFCRRRGFFWTFDHWMGQCRRRYGCRAQRNSFDDKRQCESSCG